MEKLVELPAKNPEARPMRKFIKSIPMATCGLALGLAALGNLLKTDPMFVGHDKIASIVRNICGGLSFVVLIIFALKLLFDIKHAKEELKTSIPAIVLPASTMALMLLCTYIKPYMFDVAAALWIAAVVVQVCMMVYFFKKFVLSLKLDTVYPSWFVTFVGIVVASVTAPEFNSEKMNTLLIGQVAFYVGFVLYFVGLIMVLARLFKVKYKFFALPARPTIAIFTAPMALLVVGYFASFINQGIEANKPLLYFMLAVAAITYLAVLIMIVPCLIKRFYPTFSSFTFPLVISAIAFRMGAKFISSANGSFAFLVQVATVTQWIAVAAILYVIIGYIRYFVYWLKF